MLKNLALFIIFIAASRFVGLPPNFSPLIALAVFIPRLSDNLSIQHLLPVSIVAITNLFLEPVNMIILISILSVFLITPAITRYSNNLFFGTVNTLLIWHFFVNGAVWITSGGSIIETYIAAWPFDFKLAISTGLYVLLFYYAERLWKNISKSNMKFFDSFRNKNE